MSENRKHITSEDRFSKAVKNKLYDHNMIVDDACWGEIESKLLAPRKTSIYKSLVYIAALVASILLFVFLLPNEKAYFKASDKVELFRVKKEIKELNDNRAWQKEAHSKELNEITHSSDTIINWVDLTTSIEVLSAGSKKDSLSINPQDSVGLSKDDIIKKKDIDFFYTHTIADKDIFPIQTGKSKNKILVAAVVGYGASQGLSTRANDIFEDGSLEIHDPSKPPIINDHPPFENGLSSNQYFEEVDHAMPLSFGFTIRKDLTKTVGVESGLVYTYLSSKMRTQNKFSYLAKQELHYVGIPINIIFNLKNTSKWNAYISTGIMVEKGIWGSQKLSRVTNNDETIQRNSGTIKGVQWSLSTSIGATYKMTPNWGIYLEPKSSYYFNNNQPVSIRTKNSIVIGVNGGFRYQF